MAEIDKESKTEQPTDQRLRDAIEEGRAPIAREPSTAAWLWAVWLVTVVLLTRSAGTLADSLRLFHEQLNEWRLDTGDDGRLILFAVAREAMQAFAPSLALIAAAGVTSYVVQMRTIAAWARLKPEMNRISPFAGLKRLFGKSTIAEFGKSVVKITLIAFCGATVLRSNWSSVIGLQFSDTGSIANALVSLSASLLVLLAIAMTALGTADVLFGRSQWLADLRMTKQEVKDETKQNDGDPLLAARRRAIARQRIRRRLATVVPKATVVVTNPTHFAVALRYVEAEMRAPIIVAKGQNEIALSIRRLALTHEIPIIEDRPLARALYQQTEVDQAIPHEFYRAVADVLIALRKRGIG